MVSFSLSIDTYIGRYWSAWREVRTRRARSRTRRRGRGHGKPRGWAGAPPARRDADQRPDHDAAILGADARRGVARRGDAVQGQGGSPGWDWNIY